MAIASVGTLGARQSKSNNQSSFAYVTQTTAINIGNAAVIVVAVDNNQTTDGDEGAVSSVTDSAGNAWVKAKEFCNGQGTAQTGATCSVWYCADAIATLSIGGTITINFTNNTSRDAAAVTGWVFSKASSMVFAVEATNTLAEDGAVDPGSLNATTSNIECLRLRAWAQEDSNTNDITTVTSGWTKLTLLQTTGGAGNTNMGVRGEFHISTGTGDASNPTYVLASIDLADVYAAFRERKQVSAAAGTLSLSATLSAAGTKKVSAAAGAFTPTLTFAEAGKKAVSGAASLSVSAIFSEVGKKAVSGAASLSVSAIFAEVGKKATAGAAGAISLSAALVEAGRKAVSSAVSIALSASFAEAGAKSSAAALSMTALATLLEIGTKAATGSGVLTAAAALTELGTKDSSGAGAIAASASPASDGYKGALAALSLIGAAVLVGTGVEGSGSVASLSLVAMLLLSGSKDGSGAGLLGASVALEMSGAGSGSSGTRRRRFMLNDE